MILKVTFTYCVSTCPHKAEVGFECLPVLLSTSVLREVLSVNWKLTNGLDLLARELRGSVTGWHYANSCTPSHWFVCGWQRPQLNPCCAAGTTPWSCLSSPHTPFFLVEQLLFSIYSFGMPGFSHLGPSERLGTVCTLERTQSWEPGFPQRGTADEELDSTLWDVVPCFWNE